MFLFPLGDGSGWFAEAEVRPPTPSNAILEVSLVCAANVTGYQIFTADSAVDPTTRKTSTLNCFGGQKALVSGLSVVNASNAFLIDSELLRSELGPDGTSWSIAVSHPATPSWRLRHFIVCADLLPGYTVQTTTSSLASTTTHSASVPCAAPAHPLMGGFTILDANSLPRDGILTHGTHAATAWSTAAGVPAAASIRLQARAVCIN